ncbi:MAG: hypothetical protein R3A80_02855 [Bdellovibrionota bacterium]
MRTLNLTFKKHGFGTTEVLIGLIIAGFAAAFVMQSYNSQAKQQELAQFRVQMSLTQNEVFALLNKYERSYWASQIATDPLLAACFNGQGSNCDTSFLLLPLLFLVTLSPPLRARVFLQLLIHYSTVSSTKMAALATQHLLLAFYEHKLPFNTIAPTCFAQEASSTLISP